MKNLVDAHVIRNLVSNTFDMYLRVGSGVITNLAITVDNSEGTWKPPAVALSPEEAQILFQALWDAGLRPNNGESSMAHVDAMKYHLEDMRKLVFREDKQCK